MPRMQTTKDQGQYRVLTYRIYCTGHPIDFSKCDLALPACSQCLKTARVCEGYRTESDLLFRDHAKGASCETGGQRARVRSSAQSNLAISSVCKLAAGTVAENESARQVAQQLSPSLRHSSPPELMEDQALCFFFSTYATSQSAGHQASFCAQLPEIYKGVAEDHTLKHIIPAIGLGGLARRRGDPGLLVAADSAYSNALRRTNRALCCVETATSDQTLIGVLLLGLYEASLPSSHCGRQAS
jgi:hypothetical protein